MSAEYKALPEDQRSQFEQLGRLGAELHKGDMLSFGPRRRNRSVSSSVMPSLHQAPAAPSSTVDAGASVENLDGDGQPQKRPALPPFVLEARAARREALHDRRSAREASAKLATDLAKASAGPERRALVGNLTDSNPDIGNAQVVEAHFFSVVSTSLPTLHFAKPAQPKELDDLVAKGTLGKLSRAWAASHTGIMHATLPPIQCAKARRRFCQEAQRCVCTGAGKELYHCSLALQAAMGKFKKMLGETKWNELARGAHLVLRFSWKAVMCILFWSILCRGAWAGGKGRQHQHESEVRQFHVLSQHFEAGRGL